MQDAVKFVSSEIVEHFVDAMRLGGKEDFTAFQTKPILLEAWFRSFGWTPTTYNAFAKCPTQFFFQYIMGAASQSNDFLAFGLMIDDTLNRIYEMRRLNEDKHTPSIEECLVLLEEEFAKRKHMFQRATVQSWHEHGKETIAAYYSQYLIHLSPSGRYITQYNFPKRVIGGIPMAAISDVATISQIPNKQNVLALSIVDHKTGKFRKDKFADFDTEFKDHATKNCGGDYYIQAIFYYLCTHAHNTTYNGEGFVYVPRSIEFHFVEPDEKGKITIHTIDITSDAFLSDVERFKRQLNIFHDQIGMFHFGNGCKDKDCYYCSLLKDNKLKIQ